MTQYYNRNYFYEVEKIITRKKLKRKKYYLIKWQDYPINDSTWEPISNLKNIRNMILDFEKEYPKSIDKKLLEIFQNENTKNKPIKSNEINLIKKKVQKKANKDKVKENFNGQNEKDELDLLKDHLYISKVKNNVKKEQNNFSSNFIIDLLELESLESTTNENQKENEVGGDMKIEIFDEDERINLKREGKLIKPKINL